MGNRRADGEGRDGREGDKRKGITGVVGEKKDSWGGQGGDGGMGRCALDAEGRGRGKVVRGAEIRTQDCPRIHK